MIVFSEDYGNHLPMLKKFITDNLHKQVDIPTVRINGDGSSSRKIIHGTLTSIEDNSFTIITREDYYGIRDHSFELLIRFDSVLGIVPLHPQQPRMDPLAVDTRKLKHFFTALTEMKDIMKECLNTTEDYAITLFYRYTKANPDFREGNYKVDCSEIIEVNRSNLKYKHLRTTVQLPGKTNYHYVDLHERDEIDRFIAPDRYLWKLTVIFGVKHEFNFHDDDNEN